MAYGIISHKIDSPDKLTREAMTGIMATEGPVLTEVMIPSNQLMIPSVQSMRSKDGKIYSGSIDVMFPYLSDSEMAQVLSEVSSI